MKGGTYVNDAFPRIITLLRKERGLSQKKAAEELQVSQALLSHYEKGIRECGLDFLIKLSNYYEVSCDELLGLHRTQADALSKEALAGLKKIVKEAEKILNTQQ